MPEFSGPEEALSLLGLRLPEPPRSLGAYLPAVQVGAWVFVSGMLPREGGRLTHRGKVGRDLSLEQGADAARIAALNALAVLRAHLGSLDRVARVIRVVGYVNSAPGFVDQPRVVDGASRLLSEVFGEAGRHARVAVGVAELPADAAVEVEMLVAVSEPGGRE